MNFTKIAFISSVAVATACGGGSSSSNEHPVPKPTPITSAASAGAASAAASTAIPVALSAMSDIGGFSGGITLPAPKFKTAAAQSPRVAKFLAARAKRLAPFQARAAAGLQKAKSFATTTINVTQDCPDGGSYTETGSSDSDTGAATVTVTFSNCMDAGDVTNGTIVERVGADVTSGFPNFSVAFNLTDKYYSDAPTYATLEDTMTMKITYSGTSSCDTAVYQTCSYTMSASGSTKDEYADGSFTWTDAYNGFSVHASSVDSADYLTNSATLNGGSSYSYFDGSATYGASVTFYGFALTEKDYYATLDYAQTIDGTIAFDYTGDDACFDGALSLDTVTPIYYSYADGFITAGKLVVNKVVTVDFNTDGSGSVTVTLDGQAAQPFVDVCSLTN